MLASQVLYQLSHLPNPLYFFKKTLCIVDFFLFLEMELKVSYKLNSDPLLTPHWGTQAHVLL